MLENNTEAFKLINLLNTIKRWWEMEQPHCGSNKALNDDSVPK